MQETCLRLMGKKLLVALAMRGKFTTDSIQSIDEGDDILMAGGSLFTYILSCRSRLPNHNKSSHTLRLWTDLRD
jgi:hypothetical protein